MNSIAMASKAPKKPPKASPAPPSTEAPAEGTAKYQPTKEEKAALDRFKQRRADKSPAPLVKVEQTSTSTGLSVDHANQGVGYALLADAFGTADFNSVNAMLCQLGDAVSRGGKVSEQDLNFLLSTIKDIKPRDQFEAMLAGQMGVVHMSIMSFARRMSNVETIQQQDSAVNAFTKLTRTFTAQLEALRRYRTGGEQKVTVQHVTVSEGGQAIVGNVTTWRRARRLHRQRRPPRPRPLPTPLRPQ